MFYVVGVWYCCCCVAVFDVECLLKLCVCVGLGGVGLLWLFVCCVSFGCDWVWLCMCIVLYCMVSVLPCCLVL